MRLDKSIGHRRSRCSRDRAAPVAILRKNGALFCSSCGAAELGVYDKGRLEEIRAASFKLPVVDSTGCGDAYNAGFIKGLSMGWSLQEAARLASACGGLTIQGLGSDAGIVDFERTMEFIARSETLPLRD